MKTVYVKPSSSVQETLYLLLSVGLILFFSVLLIFLTIKPTTAEALKSNEISAFKDLNNIENSFYADLTNAALEIEYLAEEMGKFPTINILEDDELEPFVRGNLWKQRGMHRWSITDRPDVIFYLGISSDPEQVGHFLVQFHKHEEEEQEEEEHEDIYFTKGDVSESLLTSSLQNIYRVWKKIVPYTGSDIRENL